jgi:peptide/nickel transport system permease protein
MSTPLQTRVTMVRYAAQGGRFRQFFGALWRRPLFRAVLKAALTIYIAITLTFFIVRLMPGNPVDIYIAMLTVEQGFSYDEARSIASGLFNISLDTPMHEQYVSYVSSLARGDLGDSLLSQGQPVTAIILQYLPWTLFAVGTGLLLSFALGIFLGVMAAYRRNSPLDHGLSSFASITSSVPDYLIAITLVVVVGVQLRLLPITQMRGTRTPGIDPGLTPEFILDVLFHAILPIATYVLGTIGIWILSMKASTLAALEEDYVSAARARGLSDGRITTAYVGRNAVLPLFAQFAIATGSLIGASTIVEWLLIYQGLGLTLYNSILQRDYPVMQAVFLVITITVVVANLVADVLYTRLDPRIRGLGSRT